MQIKKETTGHEAFLKLSALCARSEHCQHEMTEKMRQWGVSDEEQAQVMARLVGERYVDDERYARAFVRDKVKYNKWGRRKIEQALWMKRIDEHTARQVLSEVGDEEYADVLRPLLSQKRRSLKGLNDYELRQRLVRFALQRGFDMQVIRLCMEVGDVEDNGLDGMGDEENNVHDDI